MLKYPIIRVSLNEHAYFFGISVAIVVVQCLYVHSAPCCGSCQYGQTLTRSSLTCRYVKYKLYLVGDRFCCSNGMSQ